MSPNDTEYKELLKEFTDLVSEDYNEDAVKKITGLTKELLDVLNDSANLKHKSTYCYTAQLKCKNGKWERNETFMVDGKVVDSETYNECVKNGYTRTSACRYNGKRDKYKILIELLERNGV